VVSRYGSDDGLLEHREALLEKLCRENKLTKSSVMVTAGADQVFVNLVLTPCDVGDFVVMLAPYYFNACMIFQMAVFTDIIHNISWDCDPKTLHSDVGEITIIL